MSEKRAAVGAGGQGGAAPESSGEAANAHVKAGAGADGGDAGAAGGAAAGEAERTRLWMDTKGWMDEVCKRLQLSTEMAALRASVKRDDFDQWYSTGQPQHVTRQLRVWIKQLLQDAQVFGSRARCRLARSSGGGPDGSCSERAAPYLWPFVIFP